MALTPGQLVDPAGDDLHVRLYIERQMGSYAERHICLYTHTIGALARYDRPAPALGGYDALLEALP
jgi:hypothetical protein